MLWDRGYWQPEGNKTPEQALAKGDFKFTLDGARLHGSFVLVRMRSRDGEKRTNWLLIKHIDDFSVDEDGGSILDEKVTSVASGRTMEAIAAGKGKKPKPFMTTDGAVEADAVWDRSEGLAAEERAAGVRTTTSKKAKSKPNPKPRAQCACPILSHPNCARPCSGRRPWRDGYMRSSLTDIVFRCGSRTGRLH